MSFLSFSTQQSSDSTPLLPTNIVGEAHAAEVDDYLLQVEEEDEVTGQDNLDDH